MPFPTPNRSCLIILILAGLCLAAPVNTAQAAKTSAAKGNAPIYEVKSGDSLDRIAKKTGTTVAELQRLNQLSSSALKPGQKLRLPAGKPGKASAKQPTKAARNKATADKTATASTPSHQVKKGESLYRIARRHKLKVTDLQAWNHLSGTGLKPGQTLLLSAPLPTEAVAVQPARGPDSSPAALTHTVAKGETLYQIARNSGVSVDELRRINQLQNHRLRIGQQLLLGQAPPVTEAAALPDPVSPGESIAAENVPAPSDAAEGAADPAPAEEEPALLAAAEADPTRLAQAISKLRDLPYRFGGNGRTGIDCSGFVQRVFREFAIDLPRSAREQYLRGTPVEKTQLRQGDLVFFRTYAKYPSHVGIYLGDNKMVHASTRSRKVVISDITQSYYKKRYIGAKRLVGQAPESLRIDNIRDLLQEETDDGEKSAGLTGRKSPAAARPAVTAG